MRSGRRTVNRYMPVLQLLSYKVSKNSGSRNRRAYYVQFCTEKASLGLQDTGWPKK